MTEGFAQSTIDATKWLMVFHPDQLREWLDRHPPGDVLERICLEEIEKKYGNESRTAAWKALKAKQPKNRFSRR